MNRQEEKKMEETAIQPDVVEEKEEKPLSQRDEVLAGIYAKKRQPEVSEEPIEEPEEPVAEEEELESVEEGFDPLPETDKEPQEEMVTIKVNGQEKTVPLSEVLEHGKRTLQKESAADLRLLEVSKRAKELERREAEIREFLKTQKPQEDGSLESFKKEYAQALVEDEEKAADMLANMFKPLKEYEQKLAELSEAVNESRSYMTEQRRTTAQSLTSLFKREFPALAGDPYLKSMANEATKYIKANEPELSNEDVVLRAGREVEAYLRNQFGRAEDETPKQVKQSMPKPVKKAAGRQPVKPEEKPKTAADIIREMQQKRAPY